MATMVVQLGLATMPLSMVVEGVGIDLGHDEGHGRVHAPRRGIVDHHRARLGDPRGDPSRRIGPDRHERDVDAPVVGVLGVLDLHFASRPGQAGAGGAGRREEPDVVRGEATARPAPTA